MRRSNTQTFLYKALPLVLLIQLVGLYVFSPGTQELSFDQLVETLGSGGALPSPVPPISVR